MKRSALRIGKGQCRHVHVLCPWGIINLNRIQTIHGLMWVDSSLVHFCRVFILRVACSLVFFRHGCQKSLMRCAYLSNLSVLESDGESMLNFEYARWDFSVSNIFECMHVYYARAVCRVFPTFSLPLYNPRSKIRDSWPSYRNQLWKRFGHPFLRLWRVIWCSINMLAMDTSHWSQKLTIHSHNRTPRHGLFG